MRDELKYPRAFALFKLKKERWLENIRLEETFGYIVSPCYLIKETTLYAKDGTSKNEYKVVFPRKGIGLCEKDKDIIENIPKDNIYFGCTNTTTVDFITCDYEEAIKERDNRNLSIISSLEPGNNETHQQMYTRYFIEIDQFQKEIDKIEPKAQVKKKIKTPTN